MTTAKPPSWRDVLRIHPAAELFPRMSKGELRALGEDIIEHGLTSSIVLWREYPKGPVLLIDGRNRLDGIEMVVGPATVGAPSISAGSFLAVDKVIVLDKSVDPYTYVISANINRRHLTPDDKRKIIVALIKADPERSNRQVAELAKASPTTVGTVRAKMEATGDVSTVDTSIDTKGRRQPRKKRLHRGEIDSEDRRRAKALAILAHVPLDAATRTTSETVGGLIDATLNPGADRRLAAYRRSIGERERLRARNEELEHQARRLELENAALKSEIEDAKANKNADGSLATLIELLRHAYEDWLGASPDRRQARELIRQLLPILRKLAAVKAPQKAAPPDDLDIPASLRRAAPSDGGVS